MRTCICSLATGVALMLLVGCATADRPGARPEGTPGGDSLATRAARAFGSRPLEYRQGSIRPAGSQPELDQAVKAAYDRWKAAHVRTGCGGYLVKSAGEPGQVASSASIAAGMIITAFLAGHD